MNVQFYVHPIHVVSDTVKLQESSVCMLPSTSFKSRRPMYSNRWMWSSLRIRTSIYNKKRGACRNITYDSFQKSSVLRGIALGSLYKKDRIEWALEKAVELSGLFYLYQRPFGAC